MILAFKQLEAFLQKNQKTAGPKVAGNGAVLDTSNFSTGGSTSAENLMPRACNKLGLETYVQLVAEECARVVTEQGIAAGRSPLSIAGACLYLVSHLMQNPRSPKEIGLAVEVSDGTIRTAYKLMHAQQDKIIKDSWLRRGGDISKLPAA
jgi:transcription initiation factor TFIIB